MAMNFCVYCLCRTPTNKTKAEKDKISGERPVRPRQRQVWKPRLVSRSKNFKRESICPTVRLGAERKGSLRIQARMKKDE